MRRVLLGVDDSPAGMAAARAAASLARSCSGTVLAVHVLPAPPGPGRSSVGHGEAGRPEPPRPAGAARATDPSTIAVLRFAADVARGAGVPIEVRAPAGDPAHVILDLAASWPADVIVLGRSTGSRVGQPYIGSKVQHVLEFTDVPVLVVPPPASRR